MRSFANDAQPAQTAVWPSPFSAPRLGIRGLIVGPPGAGKGTLSSRLTDDFGFEVLSSGDAFRQNISEGRRGFFALPGVL